MNKKIIKYLIWTILITAALILMPTKQTMAVAVTYDNFRQNEELFCLNKGYPFHATEKFDKEIISGTSFMGKDKSVFEYIIADPFYKRVGRNTVENYTPQEAIWKLVGSSVTSADANKLIADAFAYVEFKGAGSPKPTIEKYGTDGVAITYYQATSTTDWGAGTYTNLLFGTINVEGATYSTTEKIGNTGYYKRIYTKNAGATQAKVSFYYETSRSAVLYKYIPKSKEVSKEVNIYYNEENGKKYFFDIDGYIYCYRCNEQQDAMTGDLAAYSEDYKSLVTSFIMDNLGSDDRQFDIWACLNGHLLGRNDNKYYTIGNVYRIELAKDIGNKSYSPQNLLGGENVQIKQGYDEDIIQFGLNLTINKTDSLNTDGQGNPLRLSGAEFEIKFTNVSSIKGYDGGTTTVIATTDGDGQIKLTGIMPSDPDKDVIVTITELNPPNEKPGWHYLVNSTPTNRRMNYGNSNVTITIENDPYINLSGNVWQDGQLGEKVISGPDGVRNEYYKYEKVGDGQGDYTATYGNDGEVTFNYVGTGKGNYTRTTSISEGFLAGVLVELYNADGKGNKIGDKAVTSTTTASDGSYKFEDIRQTKNGYVVVFKYDGINYESTAQNVGNNEAIDSDVQEKNRGTINANIKTISANPTDPSKGLTNEKIPLSYKESEPILKVNMNGTNPANNNAADFQVEAHTEAYKTSNDKITCGLVKKNFDLAIGTDVKEAKLTINDKTTTYNYQQIMNGEMADLTLDKILQNNSSTSDVIYNLYLYSSDYRYRIKDYQTDVRENKVPDEDNNNIADYVGLNELEAYVTYSVILKGQTTQNATIDEFIYYYDGVYEISEIKTEHFTASIDENQQKITFNRNNIPAQERIVVDITFKIKKNNVGNIIVKEDVTNIAEITKYSTSEGGLIDKDSAPGNANVTFQDGTPKLPEDKYEDDTDEAKGLNIVLRDNETRAITGTVFDDTYKDESKSEYDKDGILNNENAGVNDVIVQLIEIKKIGGQYYEYIWQETRSGSNTVKTTVKNGYHGTTEYRFLKGTDQNPAGTRQIDTENVKNVINIYVEELNGNGEYKFVDFIPGNYIIRYIYGDGTTYDVTDNVKTYNGQDYKSTIDPNYNNPWYNTSTYAEGSSVARDNEARRLEVMAYSATINGENGADLANKTSTALENTWMCAETSRINIPVDADSTSTADNSTGVSYANIEKTISFSDVNFGLALRPKTNIALEKHITALKITPSGTGVQSIVDAKADSIESIVSGKEVTVAGVTDGLSTIKSTRENRGFWQVATDVEELMQGAELEVEYTYVLRNDGEEDYLSKTLIQAYENQDVPYNTVLAEVKDTVKATMKNGRYSYSNSNTIGTYLGQVYYRGLNEDGSVPETDAKVSTRVEVFEEALNNDLAFDETEGTSFKTAREASKEQVYGVDSAKGTKETEINTVVQNTTVSKFLIPKTGETYKTQTEDTKGSADWSKTITLRTTLSTVGGGELGANLPSYIAEVLQYSNAAGRKDMTATPANLSYVHSDDTEITMASGKNEHDEFWGETIIITKPTGEDKLTPLQIAIITISAVAVLGAGIVLIKKFVLKK